MALRGTLKDFGIADIFQLIGHQGKTGVLAVRNRDQEVQIYFHDGNIIRAESASRDKKELLGAILVRAEVVTEAQLDKALDVQKKTLRRLGDILMEHKAIDAKTLKSLAKLQSTETIYRLFLWDSGHYEFKQAEVVVDEHTEPIRSENVLMEGFRQVDEWPTIRRRISGYGMVFEVIEDLDALTAAAGDSSSGLGDDDLDLDAAFGDFDEGGGGDPRLKDIGQNERIVYQLVTTERDVQKLIDLSRLGEFETCKALTALLDAEIIAPAPEKQRKPSAAATVGGIHAGRRTRWVPVVTRVALTVALVGAAVYGAWFAGFSPRAWLAKRQAFLGFRATDLQAQLANAHEPEIRHALEVFRVETGSYPESLETLVEVDLLEPRDLHFPWVNSYHYERQGEAYALLRPLY